MDRTSIDEKEQHEAFIKAAQYISRLTAQQDVYEHLAGVMVNFFKSDWVAFAHQAPTGEIAMRHCTVSDQVFQNSVCTAKSRGIISSVLGSGFLDMQVLEIPDPYVTVFLPIHEGGQTENVMLIGYKTEAALPKDLLNLFLAVAGLAETAIERLASEEELKSHRHHLEELVRERTAEIATKNSRLTEEIAERKQAEEALRRSEDQFRLLLNSTAEAIYGVDLNGDCTFCNTRCLNLLGYKETDELVGKNMHRQIHHKHPDGTPFPEEECRMTLTLGHVEGAHSDDDVFWRSDGGCFPVEYWSYPQHRDGTIVGAVVTFLDITERKLAERKLQESEERNRKLVEFLPKMIGVHVKQKWVYMNPAGLKLLGAGSEGELLGRDIQEIISPEFRDLVRSRVEQVQEKGLSSPEIEEQFIRLDGAKVDVSVSSVPIDYQGESGILMFAEDISARKKAKEELRRSHDELERSNAELQQFAYVASHDLQEPLRMVSSYMGLIEHRYKGRLDADADDFIGYAIDGAKRMRILINDLLEYSRVGTHGKAFGPVDCETLLSRVLDHLQLSIEDSGATVTHDHLPVVIGDEAQLMRLFQNLIHNSLKFKNDSPPLIHVSAEQSYGNWVFSFHDNGIGIDPQYADRIFVIFQRLHSRDEYPGTGIGLAICKKIVERHGGRIWFQSEQGKGATFFFTIPGQGLEF
ncbi:MAG: PAS domain S-box protein [Desulfomonilaceae bacterium]